MGEKRHNKTVQEAWANSCLTGSNAVYLEGLYEDYLQDPASVDEKWKTWFDDLPRVNGYSVDIPHSGIRESFRQLSRQKKTHAPCPLSGEDKQIRVLQLINAYRFRGHQRASFDPLGRRELLDVPDMTLEHHGLSNADLDTVFGSGSLAGIDRAPLKEILNILSRTYCGNVGAEYMHIIDTEEKRWLQEQLEKNCGLPEYSVDEKKRLLNRVTAAEGLEKYLHTRYVGQKRFSLEGAESLIPMLDEIIMRSGTCGVKEVVLGMAHRGRLNVLVNIMGKIPSELFLEFEGKNNNKGSGSGDVKYHMGFSSNIQTSTGRVHLALAFNPSHLEIVGPVVEGSARARQERSGDKNGDRVVPVLIHGDAAFAGQGVVMETLNMSQSRGYSTKGTVRIVINNQIGFTTSNQQDARSTLYCTDVAKMVNAPILHVNGDDPEAVLFATRIAFDYRMKFKKDVVIDMVCYRRHGHSEADEPLATQPMMYKTIKAKPTVLDIYRGRLEQESVITSSDTDQYMDDYRASLDAGQCVVPELISNKEANYPYDGVWYPYLTGEKNTAAHTGISLEFIREVSEQLHQLPEGFELHSSVAKIMNNRYKMASGALPVDWGYAETLAYASLICQGHNVRLSGQDCGRGTFFHRHAVLYNQQDGESYIPLRHLPDAKGNFLVINSLLSEEAVLAFEYGYATTDPGTLVIWEAQFGDFANNAQVVIDQFISAGEQKWNRLCNLAMFLPHGYEGQGPEHSSARLERYLQLCAEHNIRVCVPTTPAQIFHLIRRQMLATKKKPLIAFTPKSLLRHRNAVNSLEDLSEGRFQTVIPESDSSIKDKKVKRIIMCSGKVYYDLLDRRTKEEHNETVIVRIEQLYPFPKKKLEAEITRYKNAKDFIWCQEEPINQGAWYMSQHHIRTVLGDRGYLVYAGRSASAAPAVGSHVLHVKQLQDLLDVAFGTEK
ncbi:MAG: 2-oxoglutarate dehydrogenase E1 component [Gammaproteobacteria bacterium]|nr:2-oxoglutarate dehydrogenase E1 component [Gammaproteobacteria bacterium]